MLSWTVQQWAVLLTANRAWARLFLLCQRQVAAPGLGVWAMGATRQNWTDSDKTSKMFDSELMAELVKT